MTKVLIVSTADISGELRRTLLWRSDIERVQAPTPNSAFELARSLLPKLVLLDGGRTEGNLALIGKLRADPHTRNVSVAVMSRTQTLAPDRDLGRIAALSDEEQLRRAGANVVLSSPVDSFAWDYRLDELLHVPRRREARLEIRFELWPGVTRDAETFQAYAVNLSERGMLIESATPMEVGSQLDIRFTLPGGDRELSLVGQVVRKAPASPGSYRAGIEFLMMRGDARERVRAFIEAEGRP